MSREIKFRIWDGQKNEWLGASDNDVLTYYGFHLVGEVMTVQAPPQWALDPQCVVEQFTGLKDKNGKEIYEGDIIKDTSDGDCLINAVFWCEKGGFWGVKPRSPFADRDWGWFIGRDSIEVIGNIHESNMEELCPKE